MSIPNKAGPKPAPGKAKGSKGTEGSRGSGGSGPLRKVALDKPCQVCGSPIYFGYKGPFDGICGKCTDRARRKQKRRPARRRVIRTSGSSRKRIAALVLLAFIAGAIVMYLGHHVVLETVRGWFGR